MAAARVLVLSSSLHPESRSRVLATSIVPALERHGAEVRLLDLRDHPLPFCDGAAAYGDPNLPELADAIEGADAILAASPVYNYDVGANLKNFVELTGPKWQGKVVGFLLAAGGAGSYMSVMAFASSLMLDFHCHIVPHFAYATGETIEDGKVVDAEVAGRIEHVASTTVRLARALRD